MQNSKLFRILSVLEKEDFSNLEQKIKRFFPTKEDDIWLFWQLLKKQFARKEGGNFEKEYLYKKLYPKHSYNDGKMRKLMHELYHYVEDFAVECESRKPFMRDIHLLHFYYNRYLKKDLNDNLAVFWDKLAEWEKKDLDFWEAQYQAEVFRSYTIAAQYAFKADMNLPNIIRSNTIVFFASQLKWNFCILANKSLAQSISISPFFHQIMQEISREESWLEVQIIKIYYYANQLFLVPQNYDYFHYLKALVKEKNTVLSLNDTVLLATALRNYVNMQNFENEIVFQLYLEHIELGLTLSGNYFMPQVFEMVMKIGADLGETAHLENILQTYAPYLPKQNKENILCLACAYLHFAKKEYDLSLKQLNILEKFEHYPFETSIRILTVKNLIMQKKLEECLQYLQTFKVYIYRNSKLNEENRRNYLNFVHFVGKYCQLADFETDQKALLFSEIKTSYKKPSRAWLLSLEKNE